MIDIYDSEALVKVYRMLSKKCDAIDVFIKNHATYFGSSVAEYGAMNVYESIVELMNKKAQLINLKIIIDDAISKVNEKYRQILLIKTKYNLQINEICGILELKERTAFRRIEMAYEALAEELNKSKFLLRLEKILNAEDWISDIREELKERRMAFCKVQEC